MYLMESEYRSRVGPILHLWSGNNSEFDWNIVFRQVLGERGLSVVPTPWLGGRVLLFWIEPPQAGRGPDGWPARSLVIPREVAEYQARRRLPVRLLGSLGYAQPYRLPAQVVRTVVQEANVAVLDEGVTGEAEAAVEECI